MVIEYERREVKRGVMWRKSYLCLEMGEKAPSSNGTGQAKREKESLG
jgi:hypothetical protein